MSNIGHNNAPVIVELSRAEAIYLKEMLGHQALTTLQMVQMRGKRDELAENAIKECEILRGIQSKIEAAK